MITKDFTPTKEVISLHGLGFIQVQLPGKERLHVWDPDLPRRDCYAVSAIHNHRFAFMSRVLVGVQVNRHWYVEPNHDAPGFDTATHDLISHDGPRGHWGGRQSYVAGQVNVTEGPTEYHEVGKSYHMAPLAYHDTPNGEDGGCGIVVTIIEKLHEGQVHASSLIQRGHTFHQEFDRYQLPETVLWSYVIEGLARGKGDAPRILDNLVLPMMRAEATR